MRSPVGWLYFGIALVVCVVSAKSGVRSGGYQIIHGPGFGYPGSMIQRMVPAIGYRSVVPKIAARRVQSRNIYPDEEDEYNRNEQEEYGEDEEDEEETGGPTHPDQRREEEEREDEEDEERDEDEGHFAHGGVPHRHEDPDEEEENDHHFHGRQAYKSKQFKVNATSQTIPRTPSTNIRTSLQKNPSKEVQRKTNNKFNIPKRKKPSSSQTPEESSPIKNSYILQESTETNKQKTTTNSHYAQFVATPIADLILRLSISLAKPIGHGNGTATYFNVPIRLSTSNAGTEEGISSSALNASSISKVETEPSKTNLIVTSPGPFQVVAVPLKTDISENQEIDEKEEDGIDQVSS